MNKRGFFKQLASGLVVAVAPTLFLPKLVKPRWKSTFPVEIKVDLDKWKEAVKRLEGKDLWHNMVLEQDSLTGLWLFRIEDKDGNQSVQVAHGVQLSCSTLTLPRQQTSESKLARPPSSCQNKSRQGPEGQSQ